MWRDVAFAIAVALIVIGVTFYDRWRDSHASRRTWSYIRHQGGGTIQNPRLMTESEALDFARSLGAVMYVDRTQGFIFYRPK